MKRAVRYLVLAILVLVSMQSFAQIAISVNFGPPALPVYEQPPCPEEGYIWTPGYWAYDDDYGYYWVPGTWVLAPEPGYLWTPGYWGYDGGSYLFHQGYWGPHVGFYGGINYGFGYTGEGFEGGRWDHDRFYYNRAVNNINVTNIHNTYNTTVVNNVTVNRVSYNGGNGGITARPTPEQAAVAQERHLPPIQSQVEHRNTARSMPELRASTNQGKPPIAATERAAAFSGNHVMAAKEAGAPYRPPANQPNHTAMQPANNARPGAPNNTPNNEMRSGTPGAPARPTYNHASELPQHQAAAPPNTGNAQRDQKYQQQQQQLVQRQNQQHQQLQMRQQQEDQRAQQQNYNQQRQQQMEQHHQQQTMQMEQRHDTQTQHLEQRQAPQGHPEGGRPH